MKTEYESPAAIFHRLHECVKKYDADDKILQMQEMFGLTRFSAHVDVGGPSHESLMKSIEIFGTKIALQVRQALAAGNSARDKTAYVG